MTEKEMLEIVKKFVEGELSIREFEAICKTNYEFRDKISYFKDPEFEKYKNSILCYIDSVNWKNPGQQANLIYVFSWILADKGIKYNRTQYYFDKEQEYYSVIPDWLCDNAMEWVEENIINKAPTSLSKTARNKWIKEKIKKVFPYEKRPPSWVQGTEDWPQDKDGNFLTFKKQKDDGEKTTYTFVNKRTNEEVEIFEFS